MKVKHSSLLQGQGYAGKVRQDIDHAAHMPAAWRIDALQVDNLTRHFSARTSVVSRPIPCLCGQLVPIPHPRLICMVSTLRTLWDDGMQRVVNDQDESSDEEEGGLLASLRRSKLAFPKDAKAGNMDRNMDDDSLVIRALFNLWMMMMMMHMSLNVLTQRWESAANWGFRG
jgi:hypothetical protein